MEGGNSVDGTAYGIIALTIGILLIVCSATFARGAVREQNRCWNLNLDQRDVKITKIGVIVVGLGFVLFGLLAFLGLVRFR